MSIKIAQLDLAEPIQPLTGLRGYNQAWVLVRYMRRPVGWVKFATSICDDVATVDLLQYLISDQLAGSVWDALHAGGPVRVDPAPSFSVIVCTRDHPDQLERQLNSLSKLDYPSFEVIVIDNAPTHDGTRRVCEKFPQFRYILEPQAGLDYARNTGWRNAKNEIVAYTDDDACVDANWLWGLAGPYADPQVHCVTGTTYPYAVESAAQQYFEMYGGMQRGFRRRVYRPGRWSTYYPLGSGRFGAGVNLSVRRSVLESLGGFDPALDVGSLSRGGGDLDIMARVIRAGGTLVYEPNAIVWHEHRRTMPQLKRQMYDYGYGFAAYLAKYMDGDFELQNHAVKALRSWFMYWGVRRLKRNLKDALRKRSHFPLNLIVREMVGMIRGVGAYRRAVEQVKLKATPKKADTAA